jgi:hypothetical protein
MKKKMWLLALVGAVLLSAGPAWAQGDFYVIAAGPTAVGTKITSLPYTISTPGFYYLTGDLVYSINNTGITINSDDVTLDLMGFRLSGGGISGANYAIFMNGRKNVEIRNGILSGWLEGIWEPSTSGLRHRVINMRVENMTDGIYLNGRGHLVKGCSVGDCSGNGIYLAGATASGNVVTNCGFGINLIAAGNVIGNMVETNASGQTGINIPTASSFPNLVDQNTVTGPGIRFSGGTGSVITANNAFLN